MNQPTPNLSEHAASNTPPDGFVQVESSLPGVIVYAPAPIQAATPQDQTFACPQCGAVTAFDPQAADVTCSHCGYVQKLQFRVDGENSAQSEFTLSLLQSAARGWGQERRELHCEACGADLSLAPNDLSATCPFCASNRVINRAVAQEGLRPNFVIPFKFDPTAAAQAARNWLGKGWMYPAELANAGANLSLRGIYLPFWTFSARMDTTWEAQVGYERQERYYDSGAKEWRSRTVIDWRWEKGQLSVPVKDMLATGTQNVSALLLEKLNPFDLSQLAEYNPGFLAGWQAKSYDIPLQNAWDGAKTRMREIAKKACYDDIPTSHVRNFSMAADFEEESWRLILLPVYLSAYQYQGKTYQLMVNGQTGTVAGQKPVAWWKVWLAIAALLLPGVILGFIGLPLLGLGGAGIIPIGVAAVLFVFGLVISGIILRKAMQSGEA